jgi:hypothetical protein
MRHALALTGEDPLKKVAIEGNQTGRKEKEKNKMFFAFGSGRTPAVRTSTLTTPKYLGT